MHSNSLVWRLNILASGFCVQYARKRCFEEISLNAETNYYENTFKYQDMLHYKSRYICGYKAGTKLTTGGSPRRVPARATWHLVETKGKVYPRGQGRDAAPHLAGWPVSSGPAFLQALSQFHSISLFPSLKCELFSMGNLQCG